VVPFRNQGLKAGYTVIDTTTLNNPRFSIRITVVGVFVLATLVTAMVAIGLQYHFSRELAIKSALTQFKLSASGTGNFLSSSDSNVIQATKLLAAYPKLIENNHLPLDTYKLFSEVIKENNAFYGVYIGFDDGRFYELVNLESAGDIRQKMQATPEDRWVIIEVANEGAQRKRRFEYYNRDFELRRFREERSEYDPRRRPWFINATTEQVYKSPPYLFQQLQIPGQTYSIALPEQGAVLAVDVTLATVSTYLQSQQLDADSEIYLYQSSGEVIASNHLVENAPAKPDLPQINLTDEQKKYIDELGVIRVSNELDWPPMDYAVAGEPRGYAIDLIRSLASMTGLKIEFVNGYSWPQLVSMFKQGNLDIIHPVLKSEALAGAGLYSDPMLDLPYAIITKEGVSDIETLQQLRGKTLAIPEGWSLISIFRNAFPDIRVLETSSNRTAIEAVLTGEAYGTIESAAILHHTAEQYFYDGIRFHEPLPEIDKALPHDFHLLVKKSLAPLADILNLAIHRFNQSHRQTLTETWLTPQDSNLRNLSTVPYPELFNIAHSGEGIGNIINTQINDRSHFIFVTPLNRSDTYQEYFAIVVPEERVLAPSLAKVKTSMLITCACLLLLIPISWLFANPIVNPIRRLALENAKIKNRQFNQVEYCRSSIIEVHELSESMLEMSSSIEAYEVQLKELMQSLVQLIAEAIDEKSPYTAGHCARVPELSVMIAEAAERSEDAPFADFKFNDSDEYREFKLAAWLHDCGKITTPEHIVDKSTKLELIYNRIHEVRTRFEVLWRDAEIDYLRQLIRYPEQAHTLRQQLDQKQAQLKDDFAFVAGANIGAEFLSAEDAARLNALAETPWQRHFDDRLGVSAIELERYGKKAEALPVRETLLANKPQHLIERVNQQAHDPRFGIQMDIPEHLYNQGELYNLLVSRGTLTAEDRFKINEHMIGTIKLLDNLPFPPELANVPRYASTHHETLTGTGYPRRLSAEDLSIPERIIAIADIFEALTAADRPYKVAKPISEAVDILFRMAVKGNIDRDVFNLFLGSGVYKKYAQLYLDPAQIDSVDIKRYIQAASELPQ